MVNGRTFHWTTLYLIAFRIQLITSDATEAVATSWIEMDENGKHFMDDRISAHTPTRHTKSYLLCNCVAQQLVAQS